MDVNPCDRCMHLPSGIPDLERKVSHAILDSSSLSATAAVKHADKNAAAEHRMRNDGATIVIVIVIVMPTHRSEQSGRHSQSQSRTAICKIRTGSFAFCSTEQH